MSLSKEELAAAVRAHCEQLRQQDVELQTSRETVRGTIMAVAKVIQARRETVRGTIVAVRNAASHGRGRIPGYRSCRRKRATHRFGIVPSAVIRPNASSKEEKREEKRSGTICAADEARQVKVPNPRTVVGSLMAQPAERATVQSEPGRSPRITR